MSSNRLNKLRKMNSRQEFQSSGDLFRPDYSQDDNAKNEKLWKLMQRYQDVDRESI